MRAVRLKLLFVLAALAMPAVCSAQIKLMTSGGFAQALEQLLLEFERQAGIEVAVSSGSSQGNGPNTIGSQLRAGAVVDMLIMSREGLDVLIAEGRVMPGTDVNLAQTPLSVGYRTGAPKPDISSVEAFKRTLREARVIAFPGSTSGIWLKNDLLPRLGLMDDIEIKNPARGSQATGFVASGEAVLTLQPASEIVHVPGVEYGGPVPKEIQFVSVFTAAILKGAANVDACKSLIAFLASDKAHAAIANAGMEPASNVIR